MRPAFVLLTCSISALAIGGCGANTSKVRGYPGTTASSLGSAQTHRRVFQEIPTRIVARDGPGAYRDPAGWTITVPRGWQVVRFKETRTSVPIAGSEISNVRLSSPLVVRGAPLQVRGQDLPATGVGVIIGNAPQPAVPLSRLGEPPLPPPDPGNRTGWVGVSNGGDSGLVSYLRFKLHGKRFIASISGGSNPPRAAGAATQRIVRSLREVAVQN
jgi:hypothetical protein